MGHLAGTNFVSTYDVADALGVSVTTVKRWVDEGILKAHKTVGKHRKFLPEDVLQFIRENDFPRADLTRLNVNPASFNPEHLANELFEAMRRGDRECAYRTVFGARDGGLSIPRIADSVIGPALYRVGDEWERGSLTVMEEHRGTALCIEVLHLLRQRIDKNTDVNRPIAVGGCPQGDFSIVGSLMVELTLLELGWQTTNLGPHTPVKSFTKALRDMNPKLIWISSSHVVTNEFLDSYPAFFEEAEQKETDVVLGGRALAQEHREHLRSTSVGLSLSELAAHALGRYQKPRKPRRGRPPKKRPQV